MRCVRGWGGRTSTERFRAGAPSDIGIFRQLPWGDRVARATTLEGLCGGQWCDARPLVLRICDLELVAHDARQSSWDDLRKRGADYRLGGAHRRCTGRVGLGYRD